MFSPAKTTPFPTGKNRIAIGEDYDRSLRESRRVKDVKTMPRGEKGGITRPRKNR